MLTVKQAAEALGVSTGLIYAMVSARKIDHIRVGLGRGIIRIPEEAIEEYRKRNSVLAEDVRRTELPMAPPVLKHLKVSNPRRGP
ncbi:MAG: helix-turn-helix domain-containing protein [Alphaproteobacteria bacterium]|nr:helix-turn-helix domain-containing protein [Alphaproteobacteria bacterium]